MKSSIAVFAPSALALALLSGCASTQAPQELVDARAAYHNADAAPPGQVDRAALMDADQALKAAEHEFRQSPSSDDVKTLGYVAQRKAELAQAKGRAAAARNEKQRADMMALQLQAAQAQKEAEVEREQADTSGRRAKLALDQLGLAAKDEPRGTVITLPGANMFATDKADILPSAVKRLTEIATGIKSVLAEKAPSDAGRKMTLIGYTDKVGSAQHNIELSKKRAESVRVFFSKHGLDAIAMEVDGRGDADPIAANDTKDGRAQNRRVEIVISPPGAGTPSTIGTPSSKKQDGVGTPTTPTTPTTPSSKKPDSVGTPTTPTTPTTPNTKKQDGDAAPRPKTQDGEPRE